MADEWIKLTQLISEEGSAIVRPWKPNPLAHLQLAIRRLRSDDAGDGEGPLEWHLSSAPRAASAEDVLWPFMTLAGGEPQAIRWFAERFGSLARSGEACEETDASGPAVAGNSPSSGPMDATHSEPLSLWRLHAQGLGRLLALSRMLRVGGAVPSHLEWSEALGAVAVPAWLNDPGKWPGPPTAEDMLLPCVELIIGGDIGALSDHVGLFNRVVTAMLRLSGVHSALVEEGDTSHAAYAVDAVRFEERLPEGLRTVWRVEGLLPILACAMVQAFDDESWSLCTRCNKPARKKQGGRGPRKGSRRYPWYGDHESCRTLARVESMNAAEDARAVRRAALREASKAGGVHGETRG